MAHLFVNVTHGPEHPTRAALGFRIAGIAADEGHQVSVFLAGDAVQLLRDGVLDNLVGLGTGALRDTYNAIVAGGGRFYLSRLSGDSRGVSDADIEGKPAEFVMPDKLLHLCLEADRTLTY